MATSPSTVQRILENLSPAGNVRARAMFGEYGLYCDEKVVALICDNQLFMKVTPISDSFLTAKHLAPPYPGAKNYLRVPQEHLEDEEWLSRFVRQTADALPAPKPKKR